MKYNKLLGLCIFLLVFPIVSAITTYEETSSVSRIVGESPTEMLRQMQKNDISLDQATYYSTDQYFNSKDGILKEQFGSNVEGNYRPYNSGNPRYIYSFQNVNDSINSFGKNELFILESFGNADPLYGKTTSYSKFYPKDFKSFQESFEINNPLFIFDSPYGGIYLPKIDTFVSRLVRDSTIIAPSSFNSPDFINSILCELVDEKTIGEVFRDARNFHYNGGSRSNLQNYIGLVLQSYSLYGNPLQKIYMDWSEADKEKIKSRYCKNYLENLASGIDYLGQVGNYSKFRKHVVFEIPEYNIEDRDNFSVINATNTYQNLEYGELVLPMAVRTTHFPTNTIITNYSIDYIGDYVDLTINDMPSYEFSFMNRTCYYDSQDYSIEFDNAYTESSQDFVARINPVQVINCTEGKFRLYKKFNYSIDYIAISPVLIKDVQAPVSTNINEQINVSVELMMLTSNPINGTLAIYGLNNTKLYETETNTGIQYYNISFYAQPNEGIQEYSVEFINNNETADYKEFSVYTIVIEPKANIPLKINSTQDIDINFFSYNNQSLDLNVKYYLMRNESIISEGNFSKIISSGDNIHAFSFNGLKREDQSYTLIIEMNYLNQKRTINYLLNTNNVPIIYTESPQTIYENDRFTINISSFDYDLDNLIVSVNDSRLAADGFSFYWQTGLDDAGNYTFSITSSDGLLSSLKNIYLEVKNYIPSAVFLGYIKYSNGSYVEDSSISAYINETYIDEGLIENGIYNISLPADDLSTDYIEGGKEGDLVYLYINNNKTNENLIWSSGSNYANLTINVSDNNSSSCIPNWILNETWSECDIHDSKYKDYYDMNNCNITNIDDYSCYQENANSPNAADGNCSLRYNGNYYSPASSVSWKDGNWASGTGSYYGDFYINYTKPTGTSNASWSLLLGSTRFNKTIPCYKSYADNIMLRVNNSNTAPFAVKLFCYNGTEWSNYHTQNNSGSPIFFEEAVTWNIGDGISGVSQSCDYCVSSWTNINSSCVPENYYNITYSYTNSCCAETGLASDCNIPQNTTTTCNYSATICTPNWVLNTSWSACDIKNNQYQNYYDTNNCNVTNITTYSCYQETANISTICGGLNIGSYSEAPYYFYINYTKPQNATNNSLWQVKYGSNLTFTGESPIILNVSIPQNCWNLYANFIMLRAYGSHSNSDHPYSYGECFNGSSWQRITNISTSASSSGGCSTVSGNAAKLYDSNWDSLSDMNCGSSSWQSLNKPTLMQGVWYEEAMWWNISNRLNPIGRSCDYCNSTWININSSCDITNYYNITYSYANNCCAQTGLASDCTIPKNTTAQCNYSSTICNSNWILNTSWSACDINNDQYQNYYDTNNCNNTGIGYYCYQENANQSNIIDGNCGLNYSGIYSFTPNLTLSGTGYVYINYSKPANSNRYSLWQVKHSNTTENVSIPIDCLNHYSNKISLQISSAISSGLGRTNLYCYNGTWKLLRPELNGAYNYPISSGYEYLFSDGNWSTGTRWGQISGGFVWTSGGADMFPFAKIYEDAMWWNINIAQPPRLNQTCNYCSPYPVNNSLDWINQTECNDNIQIQNRTIIEYDSNKDECYDITRLDSDLWNNGNDKIYFESREVSCNFKEPDCYENSDCGSDNLINEPYCYEGNIYQDYQRYVCNNPGTSSASCNSFNNQTLKEICDIDCSNGICAIEENIPLINDGNNITFTILPSNKSLFNVLDSINGKFSMIKTIEDGKLKMWAENAPSFANNLDYIRYNQIYFIQMKENKTMIIRGYINK